MEALEDASTALPLLREYLLIAFKYDSARAVLTMICDYAVVSEGARRAFVMLVFEGVDHYERSVGDSGDYCKFVDSYQADTQSAPIVIQDVRLHREGTVLSMNVFLGTDFGEFEFRFKNISGFVRNAKVEQQGDRFVYRDWRTNREFDFFNPFSL
ncbi:hypothetical protein LZC95_05360 [Pendulispora brunnea]|uniref:SnoaL-like domain-containing protein n=1 Tax=Pendulispora brunnea TaxID=2905690 RepID=A0ABZ2KG23_9BACT